jgi:hypothetical protein
MKNTIFLKAKPPIFGLLLAGILSLATAVWSQSETVPLTGTIRGKVFESSTHLWLAGASVNIRRTAFKTTSDEKGDYIFKNVPVGSYVLEFTTEKFSQLVKTDVIVKSRGVTVVDAELAMTLTETVEVVNSYFARKQEQPVSVIEFNYEEIRRSAGSAGDISRSIGILPSVARVSDTWNGLVVRGGSPSENGFYIDNIEVPDINHFPMRGSTGGPISMLNIDFVKDVRFYSGGFTALYGDRLSSVMDIQLREGNREGLKLQLEAGMAGFGVVGEGPLGKKGSWMFSARKSYLDLIVDAIGTGVAPRYSDLQGKAQLDLSPYLKLTAIAVVGIDTIKFSRDEALDMGSGADAYGNYKTDIVTVGFTLRSLWPKAGFSDFSLSYTSRAFKSDFFTTAAGEALYKDDTAEKGFKFRNVNYLRLTDPLQLQFGVEARLVRNNYDYYIGPYTNIFGESLPAFSRDMDTDAVQSGVFANATWKPFYGLSFNLGARADYYSFNKKLFVSPRLSLSKKITERLSIVASFGIFRQNLPLELAITFPNSRELKDPKAYHYVLGLNQMLGESVMLTLEMYDKEYSNFPQDVDQPTMFLVDDFFVVGFQAHGRVVDTGRARSYGVELTLQKKMAKKLYGILCMAYFRASYLDMEGRWRPRIYDNRVLFSMEGGYKPNNQWEFSLRWTYAGGTPYTPFDMAASTALNSPIFNEAQVNGARNPAYHSLNLRLDKHWNFSKSNLTVYMNIWNAYNKKNIAMRYWNKGENKADVAYQWRFIPMGGVEFEF